MAGQCLCRTGGSLLDELFGAQDPGAIGDSYDIIPCLGIRDVNLLSAFSAGHHMAVYSSA